MDATARKKLVEKLAKAGSFDKAYSEDADRRWFIDKVIRVFGTQGVADSGMEATVKTLLGKTKTLVAAKRDFKIDVKLDVKRSATERASRGRRVEILYGLIATDPKLVDTGNTDMLDFIARRRYRTIERMALFVNPNGRGYFRYPDTCATNFSDGHWHWKVNSTAATYWEPLAPPLDVPIWMKTHPSAPATFDSVAAIGSLFTQKKDACDGNLLDCATTMNVVLMDSLLEAADRGVFAGKLAAKHVIYLSIVHVNPPIAQPESFFLTDPTAEGLFVKGGTALEDLQVGDHVYIRNHALYKTLRPTGSWSGEHALVTDCGDRRIDSDAGFRFMGHGMPHGGETGAIPRFYKGLLNEINTYLHRSYRLAAIFLNYLKSGKASPPPAKVQHQAKSVTDAAGSTFTVDYYFFDVDFSYTDFEGKPKKGQKLATKSEHGFVVAHAPSVDQFFLHHRRTLTEAVADGVLNKRYGILFERDSVAPAGLDPNDPVGWVLVFIDTDGVSELNYTLFERKGRSKALSMVPLEMYELYQEPLARIAPGATDVFTTRPRVSLDAPYLTFLKGAKALP